MKKITKLSFIFVLLIGIDLFAENNKEHKSNTVYNNYNYNYYKPQKADINITITFRNNKETTNCKLDNLSPITPYVDYY